ncbi:MAG TPA: hypothetical protein VHX19_03445 [Stellaceae bacterium]|jgi:hypothetical protein|nr:hypothetical protein [Stellaceae bacterium]
MQQNLQTAPDLPRRVLWIAMLVAASVGFTLGFACAVPFAAFGAATALTLNTRDALLLTIALWLVNQITGFGFLGYPWDGMTLLWGGVLGVVALLSTGAARLASTRLASSTYGTTLIAGFAAAFIVYEGSLYIVSAAWLGGTEDYAASIVAYIAGLNALAFVGLLILERFGRMLGLVAAPSFGIAVPRHA